MISIVMDGKCNGCRVADLELTALPDFYGVDWVIRCTHDKACDAMEARCKQQEVTANDS